MAAMMLMLSRFGFTSYKAPKTFNTTFMYTDTMMIVEDRVVNVFTVLHVLCRGAPISISVKSCRYEQILHIIKYCNFHNILGSGK